MASNTVSVRICVATRQPTTDNHPEELVIDETDLGDARPGWHKRQVGNPQVVWSCRGEVTFHQVRASDRCRVWFGCGMTPFFRPKSYESRLAASVSWQEDYEHHDETKTTAFAGTNS